MKRNVTPCQRGLLLKILGNKDARKMLVDEIRKQKLVVGKIGDGEILKLLLENADALIKIIEAIAKIFF